MLKTYEKALENSGYVYKRQISGEPTYLQVEVPKTKKIWEEKEADKH